MCFSKHIFIVLHLCLFVSFNCLLRCLFVCLFFCIPAETSHIPGGQQVLAGERDHLHRVERSDRGRRGRGVHEVRAHHPHQDRERHPRPLSCGLGRAAGRLLCDCPHVHGRPRPCDLHRVRPCLSFQRRPRGRQALFFVVFVLKEKRGDVEVT